MVLLSVFSRSNRIAKRYGVTGRELDDESGLIYFRARDYDAVRGHFIQRDLIGFAAEDLNFYTYVWNDPFDWTDRSGLAASPAPISSKPKPANVDGASSASGKMLGLIANENTAPALQIGGAAIGLAQSIGNLLAAIGLPLFFGRSDVNSNGPNSGDAPKNALSPAAEANADGYCDPTDPASDPRPEDCTKGLKFGGANFHGSRSAGNLSTITFDTMGANTAYRLFNLLEERINERIIGEY